MSEIKIGSQWDKILLSLTNKCSKQKENVSSYFSHETTTITELYNNNDIKDIICTWLDILREDAARNIRFSKNYREKGNVLFKNSDFLFSIGPYTQAIFVAPRGTPELAISHANRAIALMELGNYEEAYKDCEMALEHNYPPEKVVKVYFRQATCAMHLKNMKNLRESIQKILKDFKIHKPDEKNKLQLNSLLKSLVPEATNLPVTETKEIDIDANKIEIKSNAEVGRYVIAKTDIKQNEMIAEEKAFAFVPIYEYCDDEKISNDCQNCAITNIIPFPCIDCGRASYCSPKCVKEHYIIHKYECSGYKKNLWYHIGIAHLALRTFIVGFKELRDLLPTKKMNIKDLYNNLVDGPNTEESKSEYRKVLNLVTNFDKMEFEDVLQYSLTAVMLTYYLNKFTNIFAEIYPLFAQISEDYEKMSQLFVCSLIMRHMGQLVCNGHAITGIRIHSGDGLTGKDAIAMGNASLITEEVRLFTAIFPLISMLNHSCNPNIYNRFEGQTLKIMCRDNIKCDEEIFNCYGLHYKLKPTSFRKRVLKEQYYFDCKCEKCETDSSKEVTDVLHCPRCRSEYSEELLEKIGEYIGKCATCGHSITLNLVEMFMSFIDIPGINNYIGEYSTLKPVIGTYNDVKFKIASKMYQKYFNLLVDSTLNSKIIEIVNDVIATRLHNYGMYSLEYTMSYILILDLLALRKDSIGTYKDVMKMPLNLSCLDILPMNLKCIFTNYVKMFLE